MAGYKLKRAPVDVEASGSFAGKHGRGDELTQSIKGRGARARVKLPRGAKWSPRQIDVQTGGDYPRGMRVGATWEF